MLCRAARFCYGAAHGGQIMMPLDLAQRIVQEWTGELFELEDQGTDVAVFHCNRQHDGSHASYPTSYPARSINIIDAQVCCNALCTCWCERRS